VLKENNTSWSIGVDYKPVSDILLYANIAKGYKAGGFPEVSAAAWSQYEPIKQESLLDYELGFKSQFADRRITLNGGVFYYDYTNKQLRAKIVDGIFGELDGLVNIPKSNVKGAELEFTVRPIRGLTVDLATTYLDATITNYNGTVASAVSPTTGLRVPVTASYDGARLPFSPRWQSVASAQYQAPLSSRVDGFIGADLSSQSVSFAVPAITAVDKQDYTVAARTLVGANVGIKRPDGRWQGMIWGKNIFNKYYTINTNQDYDTFVRYAGRPAEYGVTVGYKF
jgi:iron complex outermembrane recepter protein